jgi:hypothetical protein
MLRILVITVVLVLSSKFSLADPPKYGKVELYHPTGTGFSITNYTNGADSLSVVTNESMLIVRIPTVHLSRLHLTSSSTGTADLLTSTVDTAWTQGGTIWCCWTEQKCKPSECYLNIYYPDAGCLTGGAGCEEVTVVCSGGWTSCPVGTNPGGPDVNILRTGSPLP